MSFHQIADRFFGHQLAGAPGGLAGEDDDDPTGPSSDHIRLLMVEDNEADAELVRMELERGGFDLECLRVDSEPGLLEALDRKWDLVISDSSMPGFSGQRAFEICRDKGIEAPFIFVSGALGEERAAQAMRAGARGYFVKGQIAHLNVAVKRKLDEAKNRRQRRLAEERVLRAQRRSALAIEASDAGAFELGVAADAPVEYTGAWAQILGLDPIQLPGRTGALRTWLDANIHPSDRDAATHDLNAFLSGQKPRYVAELRIRHKADRWVDVAVFASAISRADDGTVQQVAGVLLDLSGRKTLEAQLRQSQKMEAIGQLAGGVAHDFNNLLTAIFSFAHFALEAAPDSPANPDIHEVLKAAERAQSLTGQLLAFSRRRQVTPRIVNVDDVMAVGEKILRRLIGADINLQTRPAKNLWNTRIDQDELEQVLINLAVNARDAMPGGGDLTIESSNVIVREGYAALHGAVPAGEYVVISVSDSGCGMDAATQARIFEPFFTTKEPGSGTGLGLSMCYGIIRQADGHILVHSEIGRGTTFRTYLPRVLAPVDHAEEKPAPRDLRGTEVVMVVEDNDQVRRSATFALARLGYSVVEAANGDEALRVCASLKLQIDLVVTDVIMPTLGGRQLVRALQTLHPSMRVLYMSGYAASVITNKGILGSDAPLLEKPFTPATLAAKVRQVLDEEPQPAPRGERAMMTLAERVATHGSASGPSASPPHAADIVSERIKLLLLSDQESALCSRAAYASGIEAAHWVRQTLNAAARLVLDIPLR